MRATIFKSVAFQIIMKMRMSHRKPLLGGLLKLLDHRKNKGDKANFKAKLMKLYSS
jgi:hypothetical protein